MMNKQKGNMYSWVSHTWNPIKGDCPHKCSYCYMKRFKCGPMRLDEKALGDDLGSGNTIFVGSSTDMFCYDVKNEWIQEVVEKCIEGNTYVFQTKNPARFIMSELPKAAILGTTIETNRPVKDCKAPYPYYRQEAMELMAKKGYRTFITIEPIMEFSVEQMTRLIVNSNPGWVNIGADSGGNDLPEPSWRDVCLLVKAIKDAGIKVSLKQNLFRLKK